MTERPVAPCVDLSRRAGRPRRGGRGVTCGDDIGGDGRGNPQAAPASTYRLRHNRKDSRIHTMSDLLGYLLVASDPLLSSLGLRRRRSLYRNRHGRLCSRRSWRCWQIRGRARPWWQKTRMTAPTAATAVMTTTTTAAAASEARVEPPDS